MEQSRRFLRNVFSEAARKDSFPAMLTASLSWEPMAQVIFWQLVHGESVPIDWAVQAIPRLQYAKHPEAVSNIYIMLSR
uniref:Ints3-like C-terminal domain-containing protein n=1 Tax=Parascaris equorum TaxID=6256 RepID=A0A914RW78_PAREQ